MDAARVRPGVEDENDMVGSDFVTSITHDEGVTSFGLGHASTP